MTFYDGFGLLFGLGLSLESDFERLTRGFIIGIIHFPS
jgi:hypothetical protein